MFDTLKHNALLKKARKYHQLREEGDNHAVHEEIKILKKLAQFYEKKRFCKKFPKAEWHSLEVLRKAAMLGDANAQYGFGDKMLKQANDWLTLQNDFLASNIHTRYANLCYEQAFGYLEQAEAQGHPLAKRLRGLALIHGWGKEKHQEEGTRLIIESIKEEGTWEKANDIFEQLGLHSPEIFNALMSEKAKQ